MTFVKNVIVPQHISFIYFKFNVCWMLPCRSIIAFINVCVHIVIIAVIYTANMGMGWYCFMGELGLSLYTQI